MGKIKFTEYQKNFIKDHYHEHGTQFCESALQLEYSQIQYLARKFKLTKRTRIDKDYPISHFNLFDVNEIKAYCLGLLWTDGCVHKKQIFLITTEPDGTYFEPKMMSIGKWGVSRSRNIKYPSWKERVSFQTTNPFLADKLKLLNFNNKNLGFHLLYQEIPNQFKKYFWIGMVDGDGSFYYNEQLGSYRFSLCSSYDQNWECFTNLLTELNIKYYIERTMSKTGNYSKVHINGKYEIKKFGDYLYSTYEQDKLGLARKYERYILIKNRCKDIQPKYWGKSKKEIKILKSSELPSPLL